MSTVYLDIETASAEKLYTYGPGFCRLAAYAIGNGPVVLTSDMEEVCDVLSRADRVVAHNALAFDLAALGRYHGLDVGRMVEEGRVRDTLILARLNDPPLSGHVDDRRYSLDALARRLLGDGKVSTGGESALKRLESEFGGYDQIPVDDLRYRGYLIRDVELVRAVFAYLCCDEYALREHRVAWRLGHISRYGFRVDVAEAERRLASQSVRVAAAKERLARSYGLPSTGKAPQRSKEGITALEQAFADCGVEPPRTAKGALATGKDALAAVLDEHPDNEALAELVKTVRSHWVTLGRTRARRTPLSQPWVSAEDIATHLGVTKDTVYAWIAERDMPAHKVGRLWKFQADEVDEWVRSGGPAASGDRMPPQ